MNSHRASDGKTTPTRYHDADVQLVNKYAEILGRWAAQQSHPANSWPLYVLFLMFSLPASSIYPACNTYLVS